MELTLALASQQQLPFQLMKLVVVSYILWKACFQLKSTIYSFKIDYELSVVLPPCMFAVWKWWHFYLWFGPQTLAEKIGHCLLIYLHLLFMVIIQIYFNFWPMNLWNFCAVREPDMNASGEPDYLPPPLQIQKKTLMTWCHYIWFLASEVLKIFSHLSLLQTTLIHYPLCAVRHLSVYVHV